jgi:hypothetical protein
LPLTALYIRLAGPDKKACIYKKAARSGSEGGTP